MVLRRLGRGGGGHPRFEVSYRWAPERKSGPDRPGRSSRTFPSRTISVFRSRSRSPTERGTKTHRVDLAGWETTASPPAAAARRRVTFDKGGWLVCEVIYMRPIRRSWRSFPARTSPGSSVPRASSRRTSRRTPARSTHSRVADPSTHWGLKQEAAVDLGKIGSGSVAALEGARGRPRVRRAAALALGHRREGVRGGALRRRRDEKAEDVVAAAEISLGRLGAPGAKEFLMRQLARSSRWWDSVRLGALLGLGKLGDPSLASTFESTRRRATSRTCASPP